MLRRVARLTALSQRRGTRFATRTAAVAAAPRALSSSSLEGSLPVSTDVLYRHDAATGVATVTLNRPATLNAMTTDMGVAFEQTMRFVTRNHTALGVRALVLAGAGRAFSAGGDLDYLLARSHDTPTNNFHLMNAFYRRFLSIAQVPVPTVTALHGAAIGAGLCVSLATDVRVASGDAQMGLTFVALGLHPGMGCTHFLPKVVGHAMAQRLLLTGEVITGTRARDIGLVTELSATAAAAPGAGAGAAGTGTGTGAGAAANSADAVLSHAQRLAASMAAHPPAAMSLLIRTTRLRDADDAALSVALHNEANGQALSYAEPDFRARVLALKAKASRKAAKAAKAT